MRPEFGIDDDLASVPRSRWSELDDSPRASIRDVVKSTCSTEHLWGADLTKLPGFTEEVARNIEDLIPNLGE
jgi:hypothetical protein